jgi:flagellar biosynthesis protein FliQ
MNAVEVIAVARDAIVVVLKIGTPVMLVALIVGLVVSLLQALTQIQELTLAFVPKIVLIFISISMLLPFMLTTLTVFMQQMADKIVAIG